MSYYAVFRHYVLEIIATCSLPGCAQYVATEGILQGRQVAFVDMKTKSRSRLYVEEDVIFALSWIEPWISMLSNNKQAKLSHWFLAHITLLNIVLVVSISHPHVQQLLHRWSCMVGVPRSLCFFIN